MVKYSSPCGQLNIKVPFPGHWERPSSWLSRVVLKAHQIVVSFAIGVSGRSHPSKLEPRSARAKGAKWQGTFRQQSMNVLCWQGKHMKGNDQRKAKTASYHLHQLKTSKARCSRMNERTNKQLFFPIHNVRVLVWLQEPEVSTQEVTSLLGSSTEGPLLHSSINR